MQESFAYNCLLLRSGLNCFAPLARRGRTCWRILSSGSASQSPAAKGEGNSLKGVCEKFTVVIIELFVKGSILQRRISSGLPGFQVIHLSQACSAYTASVELAAASWRLGCHGGVAALCALAERASLPVSQEFV